MRSTLFTLSLLVAAGVSPLPTTADEPPAYNRDIRPILAANCFRCHGADSAAREAELRLDQREPAVASEAIVPGDPDASELIRRVLSDDPDEVMPPPETKLELTAAEKVTLRRWIEAGAEYQRHWSFVTPEKAPLPKVAARANEGEEESASQSDATTWPRNAIDRFVLERLAQEGLTPSHEAAKETLIRRVSLDITGLPPTPEEVAAFVADDSPQAYARLVDRLLQSPRYGEHLARSWLDAARYADSNGYQYDTERTMWPWREWVIGALNDNMPFDQFTVEQLAGDLLPAATNQQRLATGFNRNHPITIEGGVIDEE